MSAELQSALFSGLVTHARVRPKQHRLSYRIYSLLLDLDELDQIDRRFRLLSIDRFNLFSFYRKDRGDRSGSDLRKQLEGNMRSAGIEPDGGPILLLTMPRLFGWAFNPLSVFFCYSKDASLKAILWEVDNTFGERHGYMIPVEASDAPEIIQQCDKAFYVSPFMEMDLRYQFRVSPPTDVLSIRIETFDRDGPVLTARHVARRSELTDRALLKAFFAIPFLTLRVVGGIHWEAMKIWLKGIGLRARPHPPESSVSFGCLSPTEVKIPKSKVDIHEPF
ncbi:MULTISPECIES: DUF1365 domain-containing protein [Rhizobium]|uniref:DUF1365 family protein n=1 Tax=Rhizobium tropici TaxID=398 RepID=A0A6P1C6V8_RHITR|nr:MULTISPECIES: DUF1365 family protein [Rhizobium]AGB73176.1 hypothetical protein RTCIAT899_PA00395 [Rhizobium tropici CIAT 899]MBB4243684.1 hypothetical protein [Rhizobium tropici]MBB5595867.1 hypothetical protein [Rhizobium tropici]MBB6493859.1 hypothetical protein [Rhizobium tropici]NEV11303.1 DUF1365 family protein [Rhizobium tropici]